MNKIKWMATIISLFSSIVIIAGSIHIIHNTISSNSLKEQASSSSPVIITEVNTPYEGKYTKVTPIEIKVCSKSSDQITIEFQFIIKNISEENYHLSNGSFQAYINDFVSNIYNNSIGKSINIAPGKQATISFQVVTTVDTKVVELHFEEVYEEIAAIFKFDVPATESTESDTVTTINTFNNIDQNDTTDLLTLDKYNQLKIGMTYSEVVEFIGSDGILSTEAGVKGTATYQAFYTWKGSDGAHAILRFCGENIELQTKTQVGLE